MMRFTPVAVTSSSPEIPKERLGLPRVKAPTVVPVPVAKPAPVPLAKLRIG